MNMPIADDNTVHFTSTLMALIRTALEIKLASGMIAQRLFDAELKKELSTVWPNLPQKTLDLLVTPHKPNELTVGKVYAALMIFDYYKQNRARRLQLQQNSSGPQGSPSLLQPRSKPDSPQRVASSNSINNGGMLPAYDPRLKPTFSCELKRPKEVITDKTKRSMSKSPIKDTVGTAVNQVLVGKKKTETSISSTIPVPVLGLENQGRAASMPRLNAEMQSATDTSLMKHSVSTVAPQHPQEDNLRDCSLEKSHQERAHHHHHHHHRCHHRKEREKDRNRERRQRSLDTPLGGQASSMTDAPGEPASELAASREPVHHRGRSHERKHHHSSAVKQRYYSCDRYCSWEHCYTKSASASCATSPGENPKTSNKQWLG
uniref:Calcium channel, voltage-dependent, N type, alpha 1B subunit, a n=2 Tax=Nothobranchius TaxID=28779 RepID=A0A1A8EVW8_9TELE